MVFVEDSIIASNGDSVVTAKIACLIHFSLLLLVKVNAFIMVHY